MTFGSRHILLLLLPICLSVYGQEGAEVSTEYPKKKTILTGYTGGMLLHLGYAFAPSAAALFRNPSLEGNTDLPKAGASLGLGGALRMHLLDHIHIGGEGYVSTVPITKSGSQLRIGWGGVLLDYYFTKGRVKPLFGFTIGGGSSKRLYVPQNGEVVQGERYEYTNATEYNASYVKTPFFMIDPYIGLEITLNSHIAVMTRLDWMLPFGKNETIWNGKPHCWNKLSYPTGPRLYIGFMFGHGNKQR